MAITHHRVTHLDDHQITFRYKDYHDFDKVKLMTLTNEEFLRRFEQHILPKGFVKIRSYGFLKNYNKSARLNDLRLSMKLPPSPPKVRIPVRQRILEKYGKDISLCPRCEKGTMQLMDTIRPYYNQRIIPGLHSAEDQQAKDRSP